MSTKPFDATLKELIKGAAAAMPQLLGPWQLLGHMPLIDADLSTMVAAADKVLRVYGDTYDWLLHVEAQSSHELDLPDRLHEYNTLLRRRHKLLVRSVVLLLRRQAGASTLRGVLRLQFPEGEAPTVFRYRVVRLWKVPVEQLLTGDPKTLPFALDGRGGAGVACGNWPHRGAFTTRSAARGSGQVTNRDLCAAGLTLFTPSSGTVVPRSNCDGRVFDVPIHRLQRPA